MKVARQERSETISGGKLFQTAGAACEKAHAYTLFFKFSLLADVFGDLFPAGFVLVRFVNVSLSNNISGELSVRSTLPCCRGHL